MVKKKPDSTYWVVLTRSLLDFRIQQHFNHKLPLVTSLVQLIIDWAFSIIWWLMSCCVFAYNRDRISAYPTTPLCSLHKQTSGRP